MPQPSQQHVGLDRIVAERGQQRRAAVGDASARIVSGRSVSGRRARRRCQRSSGDSASASSTSAAPCRPAWRLRGSAGGSPWPAPHGSSPGIANTSRPCSAAWRAVISEPDCAAASTTSTPAARPLMIRLRFGKLPRQRRRADRVFADDAAFLARCGRTARGCAPGRRGRGRCRPRRPCRRRARSAPSCAAASMPSARPDTMHRPAPDSACANACGIRPALRAGVAAADDGQRRARQQFRTPFYIEQQRRIGDLRQQRRDSRARPAPARGGRAASQPVAAWRRAGAAWRRTAAAQQRARLGRG